MGLVRTRSDLRGFGADFYRLECNFCVKYWTLSDASDDFDSDVVILRILISLMILMILVIQVDQADLVILGKL